MDEIELHRSIQFHAGLRDAAEAKRALAGVLGALRCSMDDADARALSELLPARWRAIFDRAAAVRVRNARDFYVEAGRRERVGPGFAKEHTQAVLEVLAGALEPDVVARLRRSVPSDVAGILRKPRRFPEPPPHVHDPAEPAPPPDRTLSGGRSSASDSIADTHHELAHRGSVARSSAPHAERMVATARSNRSGAAEETLASAREPRHTKRH